MWDHSQASQGVYRVGLGGQGRVTCAALQKAGGDGISDLAVPEPTALTQRASWAGQLDDNPQARMWIRGCRGTLSWGPTPPTW